MESANFWATEGRSYDLFLGTILTFARGNGGRIMKTLDSEQKYPA